MHVINVRIFENVGKCQEKFIFRLNITVICRLLIFENIPTRANLHISSLVDIKSSKFQILNIVNLFLPTETLGPAIIRQAIDPMVAKVCTSAESFPLD